MAIPSIDCRRSTALRRRFRSFPAELLFGGLGQVAYSLARSAGAPYKPLFILEKGDQCRPRSCLRAISPLCRI
jgi:hypothetical protein